MHIVSTQLLSLTCLFSSMVGVFLLPYWWMVRKPDSFGGSRYQLGLSFANCLSGGVFIATFFIGLMPEVRELFCGVLEAYNVKTEFPVTEFVIFIGFLLALGIEQYVLEYQERSAARYTAIPSGVADESSKSDSSASSIISNHDETPNDGIVVDYAQEHDCDAKDTTVIMKERSTTCHESSIVNNKGHSHGSGHGHSHTDISHYLKGDSGIRLGMLMVSMGVHSLFEGLALGLQTVVPILVNLVIGVAVHELLVAFAMGVNVARLKIHRCTAIKLAVVFSASIPFGQLVGLLIGHYHSTAAVAVSAVLQGLAAGTFIHVTFLEVIPAEFHEPGLRVVKVLFLGLGFLLLLLCTVAMRNLTPENTETV